MRLQLARKGRKAREIFLYIKIGVKYPLSIEKNQGNATFSDIALHISCYKFWTRKILSWYISSQLPVIPAKNSLN
jgi:hypothetical protein